MTEVRGRYIDVECSTCEWAGEVLEVIDYDLNWSGWECPICHQMTVTADGTLEADPDDLADALQHADFL